MKQWTSIEPDPAPPAQHPIVRRTTSRINVALSVIVPAIAGGAILALGLWLIQQLAGG